MFYKVPLFIVPIVRQLKMYDLFFFDATTNPLIDFSVRNQSNSIFQIKLNPGTHYLNLNKQGCALESQTFGFANDNKRGYCFKKHYV